MILRGIFRCQDDGIVPPDDSLWTNLLREFLKSGNDDIVFAGNARFQILTIGIQRELKVKWVVLQQMQLIQHRGGILRPEHDAVHHIRVKRNAADLSGVHWIAGADEPVFQTAEDKESDVNRCLRPSKHIL